MRHILFIVCLLVSLQALSQKTQITYGILSDEEINMSKYEKDPDAKAVVLFDKGESLFFDKDGGYDIRFTRHRRVKIFNKTESNHAEVSIPFYVDGAGKTEVVTTIKALTYHITNGVVTRKILSSSSIFEERVTENWYNKKFVFPDVQDGSIVEYYYELESPFQFNLPDWEFQDRIPTIYSEYEVRMIPFYEYVFRAQGIVKFDYQISQIAKEKRVWGNLQDVRGTKLGNGVEFQDYVHTYVMRDVPGFDDESYITSINDYLIKMDFQLAKFYSPRGFTEEIMTTWPEFNKSLLEHEKFGKYLKSCIRASNKILEEELILSGLGEAQKAQQIIEYVKSNFTWNEINSKYASQDVKDLLKTKQGSSSDINLFMLGMLNAAEIDALPLVLSTRSHGKIPVDYPFSHYTNYVAVLVNTNNPFLADGTESLLPYNRLPIRCINEKGLIVNKDEDPKWVSLNSEMISINSTKIAIKIDPESLAANTISNIQHTEYEGFDLRNRFKNDSLKLKDYFSEKAGKITELSCLNYDKTSSPYIVNLVSEYETEKLNENIIIKPFLEFPISTNKLTQKERNYPVDFIYPTNNQFECSLEIPEGYEINTFPESYVFDNELIGISVQYSLRDNTLTVNGNYNFKKGIYEANEYKKIKFYMNQIVKYFNQPVMLEKI